MPRPPKDQLVTLQEFHARALWPVAVLARITGVEVRRFRRLLVADGVKVRRAGVSVQSLQEQMPDLARWIVERLREQDDSREGA